MNRLRLFVSQALIPSCSLVFPLVPFYALLFPYSKDPVPVVPVPQSLPSYELAMTVDHDENLRSSSEDGDTDSPILWLFVSVEFRRMRYSMRSWSLRESRCCGSFLPTFAVESQIFVPFLIHEGEVRVDMLRVIDLRLKT